MSFQSLFIKNHRRGTYAEWSRSGENRRAMTDSSNERTRKEAYVTMVTTPDYVSGALVMAYSLRGGGIGIQPTPAICRPLLCMVTEDFPDKDAEVLRAGGMQIVRVPPLNAPQDSHVPEWDNVGYTKLNLWNLSE